MSSTHARTANRSALAVIGLLLAVAGALGLVLSAGGFGARNADSAIVPDRLREVAQDSWWFWPAVLVLALVLAVLGWRWLIAQFHGDRRRHVDFTDNPREGTTTLDGPAVAHALADDVEDVPGVSGATVRLRGQHTPRVDLVVELTRRADVAEVRRRLESEVVPRLREAMDDPALPVDIQLRPGKKTSRDLT